MKQKPSLAIFASGRGSNCLAILEAIRVGRLRAQCVLVVSDNEKAPVLDLAGRFGVTALYLDPGRPGARFSPEAEAGYIRVLKENGVEWIALAGFLRILGKGILAAYEGHILNIHPSLLPAFPGLEAQQQAWRAGVKVAGCTVHFVDTGVDTGPIIAQRSIMVRDTDTEESLSARILEIEHTTYVEALGWALAGELRIRDHRVVRRVDEGQNHGFTPK